MCFELGLPRRTGGLRLVLAFGCQLRVEPGHGVVAILEGVVALSVHPNHVNFIHEQTQT